MVYYKNTKYFPSHLLIFNREELHYSKNGYMPNNRTCTVAHTSNLFILWEYASCILFLPQIYEHLIDQQILSSFLCVSVHISTSIFNEKRNVQYNSGSRNTFKSFEYFYSYQGKIKCLYILSYFQTDDDALKPQMPIRTTLFFCARTNEERWIE